MTTAQPPYKIISRRHSTGPVAVIHTVPFAYNPTTQDCGLETASCFAEGHHISSGAAETFVTHKGVLTRDKRGTHHWGAKG